jgi:hypothetical protein
MGIDITFVVEHAHNDGGWEVANGPAVLAGAVLGDAPLNWFDSRSYECFSLLTGLEFSGRVIRPLVPIANVRGWPSDISANAKASLESFGDDTSFGQSWLDVRDFQLFDWDQEVNWTYMASPPSGVTVTDNRKAEVIEYAEKHGRPPGDWGVAAWSRFGFEITVSIPRRQLASSFLNVVREMEKLAQGEPHRVRCIFEFTR